MARNRRNTQRRKLRTEPLEPRRMLAANPIISEFMASNDSTLLDGNDNASDWIEIHNAGNSTADLSGWHLTDDVSERDKWSFPAGATLEANEYLVVFASGVGVADPDGNLHTNFKLSSADGYLGLFQPDLTLANQFAADGGDYPSQRQDVSYGLDGGIDEAQILDGTSLAEVLVPANGNLGMTWTQNNFDAIAAGFASGQAAVGYENSTGSSTSYAEHILTTVPSGTRTTYVRVPFEIESADDVVGLSLGMMYDDGFVAYLNGTEAAAANKPTTPLAFDSFAMTSHPDSQALEPQAFSLNAFLDLLVDGTNTLAIHALNTPSSSDYLMSPTLSIETVSQGTAEPSYMSDPTPGTPNAAGFAGFVSDVIVSHERGIYDQPFNIAFSSASPNAEIYFTFDGSEPSPSNGTLFTSLVPMTRTETVRVAAFESGFQPSKIETHTYVFLDDVFEQDPLNSPRPGLSYPSRWQGNVNGDYTVDSRVVDQWDDNDPANTDFGIREGLQSIPSISLVMEHADLWGTNGIYPDATRSIRRPGSVEYFDPATGEQFQYDVGIQMQGAASRDNARLLKHSFRLVFSDTYGPGRLNFPLFDNSDFSDINTVSLKASFTDAFATRTAIDRYSPLDSLYVRDVWMRDAQLATGNLAADSTYAHLYINGLYWGLYWPSERVDDAYLSSRLGGEREDWDIVRDFNELFRGSRSAYDQMMDMADTIQRATPSVADDLFQQIQGKNSDGTDNPSLDALLDVDNFIDYMVLHLYAGVEDWPSHNWYAARNRVDPGKGFQFFTWDQEISLDQLYRDRTDASNTNTPGELFQDLRRSPEFRLRFADRVQKHLFNEGALTTEANRARFMQRADQIEAAIIGESARWGDAREGQRVTAYSNLGPLSDGHIPAGQQTVPLLTVDHWRDARDFVHDNFFANAGDLLITRLTSDGLFTTTAAPQFAVNGSAQHGGLVVEGDLLSMTGPGQIFYTLDGSDPRAIGGSVQGSAYSGAVPINTTVKVFARSRVGDQWSALTEADFTVSGGGIVISEINYHPYAPTALPELGFDKDDFEFVEVFNAHPTNSINLLGMQLDDAIEYTFPNHTLAPGEYAVVVRNQAAFEARYGIVTNVLGEYSGGLKNSSEQINLLDGVGNRIAEVDYNDSDPWSRFADGIGATLQLMDASGTPQEELSKSYRWNHSLTLGGTPGAAAMTANSAVINEVLANTAAPQLDAIEIYNPTQSSVNLGGWYLSDSSSDLLKFRIPDGTVLGVGEFVVFDENDFNDPGAANPDRNFALSSGGETVYLVGPNADESAAFHFGDSLSFEASFVGESYGRTTNGTGRLAVMTETTFGAENATPKVGPVVISEINYHPAPPTAAALAIYPSLVESDLEFVEIHNPTAEAVDLSGWRLRGEADFDFPAGTLLGPLDSLVVVPFDPSGNANNALRGAAFLTQFAAAAPLMGPYAGSISNGEGRVQLRQPNQPAEIDPVAYVLADEVLYDDLPPWPVAADGDGVSLHRVGPTFYGNDVESWLGQTPSPGTVDFVPIVTGDYDRNGLVEPRDYDVWLASYNSVIAVNADGNGNGIVDAADYTVWRDAFSAAALARAEEARREKPRHNSAMPTDVDGNGAIEPIDALHVINALSDPVAGGDELFRDVSADGFISPLDAIRVINALNETAAGQIDFWFNLDSRFEDEEDDD